LEELQGRWIVEEDTNREEVRPKKDSLVDTALFIVSYWFLFL